MDQRIEAVRRFSRFYTRRIGVLQEGLLDSPFSLTEARVLYELANRGSCTAAELVRDLGLDAGYVSRILRGFDQQGLLDRQPSEADGRQSLLRLTDAGRAAFAPLNARSREEIGAMLGALPVADQDRLVGAMATIETLLGAPPEKRAPYLLRPRQPGDMGWIVQRHGTLYAREYGWDESFEALVARIAAEVIERFDPKSDCCWMAEKDGEIVGSAVVVRKSKRVAKLRLVIVDPKARGLGIGRRLVQECLRFARQAGYARMTLWTNSILTAARAIYETEGFHLVASEPYRGFGQDLVSETWEKDL